MDANDRQARLDAARNEVQRVSESLAAIETEQRSTAERLSELDNAPNLTRDKLLDLENARRRARQLDGSWRAEHDALDRARADLLFAERRSGGIVSIRGVPDVGLGPSAVNLLRADGLDGATMFLEPRGVRVIHRGAELLIPFAALTEITTEDETHGVAWCAARAQEPIEDVPATPVRDAQLIEPFRFGLERPEQRLSLLRGATITLGARGLDVVFKGSPYTVPYKQILVAELDPAQPPAGARRADRVWFKHPSGKVTVSHAERLVPRRDPLPPIAPAFAGLPFGASGVRKFLDVKRDRAVVMWLSPLGLHVDLDGRHWLVPFAALRFARLVQA